MKNSTRQIFLSFAALAFSTIMFGQEKENKPTAKDVAEKSAQADQIHAREVRKKQLNNSPAQITTADTVSTSAKKSAPAKNKRKKKKC